jgi:hypothetical protein
VWKDPTTGAFTRPRPIGALLGNPRWEKRLLKFLETTNVGKVGPDKIVDEIRRITRYEDWCNLVEDPESGDEGSVSHDRSNQARGYFRLLLCLCYLHLPSGRWMLHQNRSIN